jgi:NitT/TauT family transport system substrate-binding protein
MKLVAASLALILLAAGAQAETSEIKVSKGAQGVGFLPLYVMEKKGLIEKRAQEAGITNLKVTWIDIGGPAVVNDMLLSGAADVVPAGPPAFITAWSKMTAAKAKGIAAMTSIPMYLNTKAPHLKSVADLTDKDKIAVTAVKVSIPAIILQMHALKQYGPAEYARFDKYTVSLRHPDALIALMSGRAEVSAHFTSPPFHQRERKDPSVRTIMTSNEVMGGPSTFTMLYTVGRFHDENPKVYGAFVRALKDAIDWINADKRAAAQLLHETPEGRSMTLEEVAGIVADPDISFTTSPQNVMKYVDFMHQVGTIKTKPSSWKEMFFPEIHDVEGS